MWANGKQPFSGRQAGRADRRGAFTLVEMLIVVAIIGLLVSLTMGVAKEIIKRGYEQETVLVMQSVRNKVITYASTYDRFPLGSGSTVGLVDELNKLRDTDIATLVGKHHFSGGEIVDAWGKPVLYYYSGQGNLGSPYSLVNKQYLNENRTPILLSAGADGKYGTADDLMNPPLRRDK